MNQENKTQIAMALARLAYAFTRRIAWLGISLVTILIALLMLAPIWPTGSALVWVWLAKLMSETLPDSIDHAENDS